MALTVDLPSVPQRPALAARRRDHQFYSGVAVAALAMVLVGFSRTYFWRPWTLGRSLPFLIHLHGLVFLSWIVLFATQTWFVATGRTSVHRRVGVFGGWLAVTVVVMGIVTTVVGVRRGFDSLESPPPDLLAFMIVPLRDMVAFTVFAGAGWVYRQHPETHKRLFLLATLNMLPAAITRIANAVEIPAVIPIALLGFLLAGPVFDFASRRSVHRVYVWGVPLTIASVVLQFVVGSTEGWHALAGWIVGVQ